MADSAISPVYIATWQFGREACEVGWKILAEGGASLDAVEKGANAVELKPEVNSVGYGGLPNADGVVELDAAIMDGPTHGCGSVAAITGTRRPISVARMLMESTAHVMLVGQQARKFALQNGFPDEVLLTPESTRRFNEWRDTRSASGVSHFEDDSHDTVGVCALDIAGNLAAGCTTSGLAWKLPGRVGDSPIIGSGLYVDNEVGAAAATGNGDEIMKACLSFRTVMLMEQGSGPQHACEEAIRYLICKRPGHQNQGASVIAISKDGRSGQAATKTGFRHPDRLWMYALADGTGIAVNEGTYIE